MKTSLGIAAGIMVLWAQAAFAFDAAKVTQDYYRVRPACRIGEMNGQELTQKQANEQCKVLAKLGKALKANGYCWYKPEQEWRQCK
ncbi:hypothetical protein EN780_03035 [Mesorhizobium sp. M4B.F.Ca.ET.089.01.1.1]|uniref:hypothetical protein n=1 Tax=Mesorhizobium sp. M4B.F.Ca.ET.089.01.1.1 TaxID=2496662 RepID=UPI000FE42083|nr:hypothetical protein [Mesorhizobium sp. M4B.F.Ca.ET.089.01.1.1]RWX70511.1 hypothetical protein EN780_03035 [Mesorhizobium sp. M4B.F.Ca.ET.089.01.1.1]